MDLDSDGDTIPDIKDPFPFDPDRPTASFGKPVSSDGNSSIHIPVYPKNLDCQYESAEPGHSTLPGNNIKPKPGGAARPMGPHIVVSNPGQNAGGYSSMPYFYDEELEDENNFWKGPYVSGAGDDSRISVKNLGQANTRSFHPQIRRR